MCYPFALYYHYLPINRDSISTYLNYYKQDKDSYINIVPNNDYIYKYIDLNARLNGKVEQINETNKIKVKMNSLSYKLYPNEYKYYLVINYKNPNKIEIITGKKNQINQKMNI